MGHIRPALRLPLLRLLLFLWVAVVFRVPLLVAGVLPLLFVVVVDVALFVAVVALFLCVFLLLLMMMIVTMIIAIAACHALRSPASTPSEGLEHGNIIMMSETDPPQMLVFPPDYSDIGHKSACNTHLCMLHIGNHDGPHLGRDS